MNRIDSVLEQIQKTVELTGKSGSQSVFLTNVQITFSNKDFATQMSCDVDGAICDVSWFFKCAKERIIVPCGNPDASFFIRQFGNEVLPYGAAWNLAELKQHLQDPDSRRAILMNYTCPTKPPCVTCYQFQCVEYGSLDCTATVRSSDVAKVLAQDVFMTKIILDEVCSMTGYEPGNLTFNIGNAHVYYEDLEFTEEFAIDFGN